MKCYKLVRLRKNGTLGSLFIHAKAVLQVGVWMEAEMFPTKGFAPRFGWHCTFLPYAPHLSEKGRVWVECDVKNFRTYDRPESQGGEWILADNIRINRILSSDEVMRLKFSNRAA